MFDYLNKFNNLPKDLRDQISNPAVFNIIGELEREYGLDLAATVMRVMIQEIKIKDLALYLASEFSLVKDKAEALAEELKTRVFIAVAAYLGLPIVAKIPQPVMVIRPTDLKIGQETVAMPLMDNKDYDAKMEMAAADVVRSANVKINPELFSRLQAVIKLYLRGVRSKIDTRELLIKTETEGGVNFDGVLADKFLQLADAVKRTIQVVAQPVKRPGQTVLDKINKMAEAEVYDLRKVLDIKHELGSGLDLKHELAPPVKPLSMPVAPSTLPVVPSDLPVAVAVVAPVALPALKVPAVVPAAATPSKMMAPRPVVSVPVAISVTKISAKSIEKIGRSSGGKKRLEDIKQVRRMNPIDELRYMDVTNFRRLGDYPGEITGKVLARIRLLRDEDYEKGLAGIAAWRQSPVNKLYLKIINLSASRGLTLETTVAELKKQGQDYLTVSEIEAVITLNANLRF